MSAFDPNDKNIKINWRDEPDEEEILEHKKLVEEYKKKELEKRELKNLLNFAWPFIVLALIIGLGAISMNLLGALLLAIPIVPLGFLILFFLIQWIIGREKMKRYGTFITITLLIILVVVCIVLSAVLF